MQYQRGLPADIPREYECLFLHISPNTWHGFNIYSFEVLKDIHLIVAEVENNLCCLKAFFFPVTHIYMSFAY